MVGDGDQRRAERAAFAVSAAAPVIERLQACEADARGRAGLQARAYPQAARLRCTLAAASAVTAAESIARGLQGPAVGADLHQRRCAAVATALRETEENT